MFRGALWALPPSQYFSWSQNGVGISSEVASAKTNFSILATFQVNPFKFYTHVNKHVS